jgi:hypothetical protein
MAQLKADGKTAMDAERIKANFAFGWAAQKIRERELSRMASETET